MFKKAAFVVVSVFALSGVAKAEDFLNELATNGATSIADADNEIADLDLDIDVDELAENAEGDDDAVEACFRRFGYRSWGYRSYGYGYRCFRPVYNNYYNVYRPYVCRPIYHTYCRPIVNYWGCY